MSLHKHLLKSKKSCAVTFSLPKEAANGSEDVKVLGDFNKWDPSKAIAMKSAKGGFEASVNLRPGQEYQFRYLINGEQWENDWQADKYVPSPYGVENSVVVVPAE
jgi:1,4-alpha-glucan branching enzyme